MMFQDKFSKYLFQIVIQFKTGSYFLIIHNNKLKIAFKPHLFNAFLICLALLYGTKTLDNFSKQFRAYT